MIHRLIISALMALQGSSAQAIVSRAHAEHYTWGANCDGWYLSRSSEQTIIEERLPPGASETAHKHVRSRQFFYVLAGSAVMQQDHGSTRLEAGEGIEIAPGIVHRIANEAKADLRILVISRPPSHDDRIEAGAAPRE